ELDFGRTLEAAAVEAAAVAAISTIATIAAGAFTTGAFACRAVAAWSGPMGRPLRAATFPRGTRFLLLLLLLCHVLNLCHQSGPLEGHQARGPQLHFRRSASHHLADQVGAQLLEFAIARAAENPVETALEAPRTLQISGALAVGFTPVKAPQLIQELPRHAEIVDQARHGVFELRGVRQAPPFQNAAQ